MVSLGTCEKVLHLKECTMVHLVHLDIFLKMNCSSRSNGAFSYFRAEQSKIEMYQGQLTLKWVQSSTLSLRKGTADVISSQRPFQQSQRAEIFRKIWSICEEKLLKISALYLERNLVFRSKWFQNFVDYESTGIVEKL